ncbi:atp-dependent clp protease [Holotrichia oblita]|nr:atp-dependent clp protease [Holotrichia oblita]
MTSNAGAKAIMSPKKLGFTSGNDRTRGYEEMKKNVLSEVKDTFRPEFINRIDDIIVFHSIDKEDSREIVKLISGESINRIKTNMGMKLTLTEALIDYIAESGYDTNFGARPLRRAIQNKIEDKLAEEILDGKIKEGDSITADYVDGNIVFTASAQ